MNATLIKHIVETDKQAKERFEIIMKQMLKKKLIDEGLRNTGPLKFVRLIIMNNYKHCAEESVLIELIYV